MYRKKQPPGRVSFSPPGDQYTQTHRVVNTARYELLFRREPLPFLLVEHRVRFSGGGGDGILSVLLAWIQQHSSGGPAAKRTPCSFVGVYKTGIVWGSGTSVAPSFLPPFLTLRVATVPSSSRTFSLACDAAFSAVTSASALLRRSSSAWRRTRTTSSWRAESSCGKKINRVCVRQQQARITTKRLLTEKKTKKKRFVRK